MDGAQKIKRQLLENLGAKQHAEYAVLVTQRRADVDINFAKGGFSMCVTDGQTWKHSVTKCPRS